MKHSEQQTRPRFTLSKASTIHFKPGNYLCTENDSPDCRNKTQIFRKKIVDELNRVNVEEIEEANLYYVNYTRSSNKTDQKCSILNANVRGLKRKELRGTTISQVMPKKKMFEGRGGRSCVVVSSGGGMLESRLGKFIGEFFDSFSLISL